MIGIVEAKKLTLGPQNVLSHRTILQALKALAHSGGTAGIVLEATGIEELGRGVASKLIAIDFDRLIDPLHALLEPRRASDGRKQDKRVGHRAESVSVRAAPDPEAGGALPRQERGIGGDLYERVIGSKCKQGGKADKWRTGLTIM